ncbi:MAG TPA: F0F1 ATP synthase subunit delta [Alphaproteobacteria bacterium]|nr:F0F1 ATP synthase subunit delta [Alphaproteobacteria bacterium]
MSGLSGLAQRYATALFELADERKELDQIANDLVSLRAAIQESPDLQRLLASPLLDRAEQGRALTALLGRMGLGATVRNFVAVVARNRRLFALKAMADAFLADLARRRGEVRAEVVSARPLSDAQHQALLETLRRATGGKIAIDTAVDGSLIGGLVVRVGSRQIDTSLKTKLSRLQLAMKGAS